MSELELEAAGWLATVRSEYLEGFVCDGGAAVKVAVAATPGTGAALTERLLSDARALGFVAASVDAGECKVHLVQNLFFQVAKQVAWDVLAHDFLRAEIGAAGFTLPADGSLDVESLARVNDQDLAIVKQGMRSALTDRLMRDYGLSKQFRLAALALCQALLEPDDLHGELAEHVKSWLQGELTRVGVLRQAFIYQRIDRHTARTMILSTSGFIRKAGRPGLVVVADLSRYALARPPDDGYNRYSKSAALDMWEALREFIDGSDDMSGCLLVFVAGPEFVKDDQRGVKGYNALHLRLADDVHDRARANPLAPMVRIAAPAGC